MSSDPITIDFQPPLAIITLNQPKKLNALTSQLYYELGGFLRQAAARDDITVTVLTGSGRSFSAGADVSSVRPGGMFAAGSDAPESVRQEILKGFVSNNLDVTRTFYNHPKILVTALNGPVVGLSAALVSLSDFIYTAPHAFLLTPFTSLGLVTEGGACRALVSRLGVSKAKEALIGSKRIMADDLVRTGFANKMFTAPGGPDDSAGFLKLVLKEIKDSYGGDHLIQESILGVKKLICQPERDILERQNIEEVFAGMDRFVKGVPQEEFRKLASGEKRHKL